MKIISQDLTVSNNSFESCNRKVPQSNTVDIRGVYEQMLMHNYRRGIEVVLLK